MNSLDGIRILDLSRVLAGPWCTQNLADLGAEVIKVERPVGGDDTRHWGPPFLPQADGTPSAESAYFLCANRNKLSITCDLSLADGQRLILDLIAHCDVLIENFKVGDMARYGLDWESLRLIRPSLVYCSVTGFGQSGPYSARAGYDYAVQGMGGLMSVTGATDAQGGGPQKVGVAVADLFAGMYATTGILAALRHAQRTGQGQHIDIALLDVQVAMLANLGAQYQLSGVVPQRMGNAHATIVPYQVFEVAPALKSAHGIDDRDHIIVAVGNDVQFARFCQVLGSPQWAKEPRFATNAQRVRHRAELVSLIQLCLLSHSKTHWLAALTEATVPCAPIHSIAEVFDDPQVQARGMLQSWHHPLCPDLQLVSSPLKLSATPPVQARPPPMLGQHTAQVLMDVLGYSAQRVAALAAAGVIAP